jgi:hypothetical protein
MFARLLDTLTKHPRFRSAVIDRRIPPSLLHSLEVCSSSYTKFGKVFESAARLRASSRLKLPDAVQAASAIAINADDHSRSGFFTRALAPRVAIACRVKRVVPTCREKFPNQRTWRARSMMTRQSSFQFRTTMMLPTSDLPVPSRDGDHQPDESGLKIYLRNRPPQDFRHRQARLGGISNIRLEPTRGRAAGFPSRSLFLTVEP